MAIEFHCPYCTAAVRVPDSAAGKNGRCPACQTLVRIPSVRPPSQQPPAPTAQADVPQVSEQAAPPVHTTAQASGFPAVQTEGSPFQLPHRPPAAASNYRKQRKQRKSRAVLQLLLPVLLLAAGVGGVVAYLHWTKPTFEGSLNGARLATSTGFRTTLAVPENSQAWKSLLEQLQTAPLQRRSNLLMIVFGSTGKELSIQIEPGTDAAFVSVPVLSHPDLAGHFQKIEVDLEAARQGEIKSAVASVGVALGNPTNEEESPLFQYRDDLTLNVLRRGLGRVLEAVVDGTSYPCVHEDDDGQLTFVVPRNAKALTLQVRNDVVEKSLFPLPVKLSVSVTGEAAAEPPATETATNGTAPAPDAGAAPPEPAPQSAEAESPQEAGTP